MSDIIAENENERIQPVYITFKNKKYTLDFSRASAVFAQQKDFNPEEIGTKPTIVIPDLFYYAMRMHHGELARNQVDKLREEMFPKGVPAKVLTRLTQLYQQASWINVICADEDEGKNLETVVEM